MAVGRPFQLRQRPGSGAQPARRRAEAGPVARQDLTLQVPGERGGS